VPNFVFFAASIAELAHEKNRVLNDSLSLFDAPRTEAFALEWVQNPNKGVHQIRTSKQVRLDATPSKCTI